MKVTIDLSPEQEAQLSSGARSQGIALSELAHRLVVEQLPRLGEEKLSLTPDELVRKMDAIAELNRGLPALSNDAFDRASLYDDRL